MSKNIVNQTLTLKRWKLMSKNLITKNCFLCLFTMHTWQILSENRCFVIVVVTKYAFFFDQVSLIKR